MLYTCRQRNIIKHSYLVIILILTTRLTRILALSQVILTTAKKIEKNIRGNS